MDRVVDRLEELQVEFAAVLAEARCSETVAALPDADLMRLLSVTGAMQRGVDGVLVEAAVQVRDRSEGLRAEWLTTAHGCARPADLLQMALRVDPQHAGRLVKAAGLTKRTEGSPTGCSNPRHTSSCGSRWRRGCSGWMASSPRWARSRPRGVA